MKSMLTVCGLFVGLSLLTASLLQGQVVTAPAERAKSKAGAAQADPNVPKANDVAALYAAQAATFAESARRGDARRFRLDRQARAEIRLLAQDENWRVYQTLEYRQHSADFARIAGELTKAARAKNLDGATLAYLQLTMSCVSCHKYTRTIGGDGQ